MTNTEKRLLRAGWFPGRKIDIKEMEIHLKKLGYEVFPAAKLFLEQFGLLYIAVENSHDFGERYRVHHTDVKKAIGNSCLYGCFEGEEKIASEKLIPVGEAHSGYQRLFISETGKMYADNVKLGDTFMEAWAKLLTPR